MSSVELVGVYGGRKIKVPKFLDEKIAEIIGRHCGDGCCVKTRNEYRVVLTENDSLIHKHSKDLKEIFGISPRIVKIATNTSCAIVSSKPYYRFFTKLVGVPEGEKTKIVKEPIIIQASNIKIRSAFLRGLMDTDGSIYYSKRSFTLELHITNKFLAKSAFDILSALNFTPKLLKLDNRKYGSRYKVRLYGIENVRKYLEIVGTNNSRLLKSLDHMGL